MSSTFFGLTKLFSSTLKTIQIHNMVFGHEFEVDIWKKIYGSNQKLKQSLAKPVNVTCLGSGQFPVHLRRTTSDRLPRMKINILGRKETL